MPTSPGSPAYVVGAISLFPSISRVVIVNDCPVWIRVEPSLKRPSRILGPCRSTKMPTPWPDSSEAWRTRR